MKEVVSIIIPTLNRLQFIEETIKSVSQQTYKNLEIIISDNGSDNDVKPYINALIKTDKRIIFRRNEKTVSMAQHFNQCLDIAKGKYIIYISDDDLISDNFVQMMVEEIESDDSISIGISTTEIIDLNSNIVDRVQVPEWTNKGGKEFIYSWLIDNEKPPVITFISLFTKTSFLKLSGGFPDFEAGAHIDNALAINLCLIGNIVFINKVTFFYRVYDASFGLSMSLKNLALGSRQFINYYKNNNFILSKINNNKISFEILLKGVKRLSITTYISRILKVYPIKNINFLKAMFDYGLGYYEVKFLIKKSINNIFK